jgi:hypothetical protein
MLFFLLTQSIKQSTVNHHHLPLVIFSLPQKYQKSMWPLERSTSKPFLLHIEGAGPVAGELDGMEFENLLASFDLHSIGLDQLSPIPV